MTAPRTRYRDGVVRSGRPPAISKLARQANADAERMRRERAADVGGQPAPVVLGRERQP